MTHNQPRGNDASRTRYTIVLILIIVLNIHPVTDWSGNKKGFNAFVNFIDSCETLILIWSWYLLYKQKYKMLTFNDF